MTFPTPDTQQTRQHLPLLVPSSTPAPVGVPAPETDGSADAVPTLLRDLVLQAVQRAWQAQQRARDEALALEARNAFD